MYIKKLIIFSMFLFFYYACSTQASVDHETSLIIFSEAGNNFGNVVIGNTKKLKFRVTNNSYQKALIDKDGSQALLNSNFIYTKNLFPGENGTCSDYLDRFQTCIIELEFKPNTVGEIISNIKIAYYDKKTLLEASYLIRGIGVDPASLIISETTSSFFGSLLPDQTASLIFNLTNNSDTTASIELPDTEDPLSEVFNYKGGSFPGTGGTCNLAINKGTTCTIVLEFRPKETTEYLYNYKIDYEDGASNTKTSEILISGIGLRRVGDNGLAGGKIFYIKEDYRIGDAWKYLEVAKENFGLNHLWSNVNNKQVNTNIQIGKGYENSYQIINQAGHSASIAKKCTEYSSNGYNDYFVPSLNELLEIYKIKDGTFADSLYWSSSEFVVTPSSNAYIVLFNDGSTTSHPKNNTAMLRCIRAFKDSN